MSDPRLVPNYSVVLLPYGDLGRNILEAAKSWTAIGLLRPALYVLADEQQSTSGHPEVLQEHGLIGHLVTENSDVACEIFQFISSREIGKIRVIAVNDLTPASKSVEDFIQIADRTRRTIKKSITRYLDAERERNGTETLFVCLSVEDTNVNSSQTFRGLPAWDFNVLVSPEDRLNTLAIDSNLDALNPRFCGLVLINIASSAGLWITREDSPYDKLPKEENSSKVRLQRTFARAVKTDDMAYKVASSALREIQVHGNPYSYKGFIGTSSRVASEKERRVLVTDLVEKTMQRDLRFKLSHEAPSEQEKTKIGLIKGLVLFGRFTVSNLIAIPRNLITSIVETFNSKATDFLFGKNGEYEIELRKEKGVALSVLRNYGLLESERDDINDIYDSKTQVKLDYRRATADAYKRENHPEVWKFIRNEVIDLLQGTTTNAPDGLAGKLIENPKFLIPRKSESWDVPQFSLFKSEDQESVESHLDWLDVEKASSLSLHFEEITQNIRDEEQRAQIRFKDSTNEKRAAKVEIRKAQAELARATDELVAIKELQKP